MLLEIEYIMVMILLFYIESWKAMSSFLHDTEGGMISFYFRPLSSSFFSVEICATI